MLYSEFVTGTGCRENDHNYRIYRILEAAYNNMNELTHEEIYELGKKLVDNTPSAEELEIIAGWKAELQEALQFVKEIETNVTRYHLYMLESEDKENRNYWKDCEKEQKQLAKFWKTRAAELKALIARN